MIALSLNSLYTGAHLDLSAFSSPEELMSLGLDRLKSALQALSMKCGGTLEERAKRLFGTKGVSMEELQSSSTRKGRGGKSKGVDSAKRQKEIALLEAQVCALPFPKSNFIGELSLLMVLSLGFDQIIRLEEWDIR